MNRYWGELEHCARRFPCDGAEFTNIFPSCPPPNSRRRIRLERIIHRYLVYPFRIKRIKNVDLFHLLDHSHAHLLRSVPAKTPIVATVFDVVPLRDPRSLWTHQVNRFRRSVQNLHRADILIAVSHETAVDLRRLLGIPAERIRVVYPGTNMDKFGQLNKKANPFNRISSDKKIVLSVGSAHPRKNLDSLAGIFGNLSDRFRKGEWVFVRVGGLLPAPVEQAISEVIGANNLIQYGFLSDDEIIGAFQHASVFIFPSVLEGFSFTMIESMAAGLPVIANQMSTNVEVGQDAVAYYQDGDYAGAAAAIRRVLDDQSYANHLREAGLNRSKALSWANHWEGVKAVYREVLSAEETIP
jgi:glycosyltransferase involved in cell wall biosynthesis